MQTLNDYAAAIASYLAVVLALFVEHSTMIVQVLGFVLLVARLLHEIGSLVNLIKKWCKRE